MVVDEKALMRAMKAAFQTTGYKVAVDESEGSTDYILNDGVDKVTTITGYTFKEDGLRIAKAGEEMDNTLDHTGMYVKRSGETMLQANNEGVIATDVKIRNFLIMGNNSRFEDYSNGTDTKRTACFHISS